MQTFLTHPSFSESAKSLDNRRLNKQITECKQIALAILDPSKGWQNHPAVNMWRGSFASLIRYGIALGAEWHRRFLTGERGGKESHKAAEWLTERYLGINWVSPYSYRMPSWLGSPKFHASHRLEGGNMQTIEDFIIEALGNAVAYKIDETTLRERFARYLSMRVSTEDGIAYIVRLADELTKGEENEGRTRRTA